MTADKTTAHATPAGATPADKRPAPARKTTAELLHAILTDIHFWVPAIVLALGILLLIALH